MDIYRIDHDLKFLNQIGLTLEIEEKWFFYLIIYIKEQNYNWRWKN